VPTGTERRRLVRWKVEDAGGAPRTPPGGYADVARGGGPRHERVVLLGLSGKTRTEVHLKRGHVRKLERFGFGPRVPDADRA
jgi:hypothetical protein